MLAVVVPVAAEELSFRRLDRTYEGFVDQLAPIEVGPATVQLRSPEHALTLLSHAAELVRTEDGAHRIVLDLTLQGHGRVEADVQMGAVASALADDLEVPAQTLRLEGRAAIEKVAEGYRITALELPPSVTVRIRSNLAGRLVSLCRPMGLVLVSLDCAALERALGQVTVPLPPAGETFLLPIEELEPEEQERFDRYLGIGSG